MISGAAVFGYALLALAAPKSAWALLLVKACGFGVLLAAWRGGSWPRGPERKVLAPVLALATASAISATWSLAPGESVARAWHLAQEAALVLAILALSPGVPFVALARGAVAGAASLSLLVVHAFFTAPVLGGRFAIAGHDPSIVAHALMTGLVLTLATGRGPSVLLPLLGVAVGLTGNRTAWVGLGAVAALTWLRYASPRLRVGLALAGLALGIAAWEGRPDVRPAATGFVEGDVVKALAGRPRIWAAALEILQEHPLIGVGAGAFPTAWDQWREGALAAGRRAGKAHLPADNLVVGLVVELGLPGAVLGGWLVLVLFRAAPRSAVRALGLPWLGLAGLTTELLPERGVWLLVVAMLVAPPDGQDQGRRVARTM